MIPRCPYNDSTPTPAEDLEDAGLLHPPLAVGGPAKNFLRVLGRLPQTVGPCQALGAPCVGQGGLEACRGKHLCQTVHS